jgi:hypothetical protein
LFILRRLKFSILNKLVFSRVEFWIENYFNSIESDISSKWIIYILFSLYKILSIIINSPNVKWKIIWSSEIKLEKFKFEIIIFFEFEIKKNSSEKETFEKSNSIFLNKIF